MSNLMDALSPKFPDEIAKIRAAEIPIVRSLSGIEIQVLWERFSDDYCAQWLNVGESLLKEFKEWLSQ